MSFLLAIVLFFLLLAVMGVFAVRESKCQRRFEELDLELKKLKAEFEESLVKLKEAEDCKLALDKTISGMKEIERKQERRIEDLKKGLNTNSFDGRFPICSSCKDIRDESGSWHSIEEFIAGLSEAEFSHSLCPDCARKLYPDMFEDGKKIHTLTWK